MVQNALKCDMTSMDMLIYVSNTIKFNHKTTQEHLKSWSHSMEPPGPHLSHTWRFPVFAHFSHIQLYHLMADIPLSSTYSTICFVPWSFQNGMVHTWCLLKCSMPIVGVWYTVHLNSSFIIASYISRWCTLKSYLWHHMYSTHSVQNMCWHVYILVTPILYFAITFGK